MVDGFYLRCGVLIVGTISQGDCGVDVMALMCGAPRTAESYWQIRRDLSDWVLDNGEHEGLQNAFPMLGEYTEEVPELSGDGLKQENEEFKGLLPIRLVTRSAVIADKEGTDSREGEGIGVAATELEVEAVRWASGFASAG